MSNRTSSSGGGIIIDIPRKTTFELPEGNYAAIITSIKKFTKQTNRGAQEWIRFLFKVEIPSRSNFVNMAGRSFERSLDEGSELCTFLTGLLGRRFFHDLSGGQLNLEPLINTKCEVVLVHYSNGKYEHPMVVVDSCHKPGTLNLTEKPPVEIGAHLYGVAEEKGGKVETK